MSIQRHDLVAIGGGPAGRAAALEAAGLGASVALVDRRDSVGGVATNVGVIPARVLGAALGQVGPDRWKGLNLDRLFWLAQSVVERDDAALEAELAASGIERVVGSARFASPVELTVRGDRGTRTVRGDTFVVAPGARPQRPAWVAFDQATVLDAGELFRLHEAPRRACVVGAGTVGLEYASYLAALGSAVVLLERAAEVATIVDVDAKQAVFGALAERGLVLRTGADAERVTLGDAGPTVHVGGELLECDVVLWASGREPATDGLDLARASVELDENGFLRTDGALRTSARHIYGAGSAVADCDRATVAARQGRDAARAALAQPALGAGTTPAVVYTLPAMASVGAHQRDLDADCLTGIARHSELTSGRIAGDVHGLTKLVAERGTRRLLGAVLVGGDAPELIHVAQALIDCGQTLDVIAATSYAQPTFAEAFGQAARRALRA